MNDPNNSAIFQMAQKDLAALEGMLFDNVHFSDEVFGFHAEQAVEKSLKAWIAALGKPYPFTHDLSMLLHTLHKNGVEIDKWLDLLELSSFGVQFRYEEMTMYDEKLDREFILEQVKQLMDAVKNVIPGKKQPLE